MRRRLRLAMVVLSLAAFVGACGGGDDDDEDAAADDGGDHPHLAAHDGGPGLASVFKPVAGYAFVELPPALLEELESELTADPEFNEVVEEVEARTITRNGEGVGIVMAMDMDDRYVALPGVEDGIIEEFAEGAASDQAR